RAIPRQPYHITTNRKAGADALVVIRPKSSLQKRGDLRLAAKVGPARMTPRTGSDRSAPLADALYLLINLDVFRAHLRISGSIRPPGANRAINLPAICSACSVSSCPHRNPPAAVVPVGGPELAAVPAVFVLGVWMPGAAGALAELPAPLGSLPELFRPPALATPEGPTLPPAGTPP